MVSPAYYLPNEILLETVHFLPCNLVKSLVDLSSRFSIVAEYRLDCQLKPFVQKGDDFVERISELEKKMEPYLAILKPIEEEIVLLAYKFRFEMDRLNSWWCTIPPPARALKKLRLEEQYNQNIQVLRQEYLLHYAIVAEIREEKAIAATELTKLKDLIRAGCLNKKNSVFKI